MSFAKLLFMHCASILFWILRDLITPEKWSSTLRVFLGIIGFSERKQGLLKNIFSLSERRDRPFGKTL
jgi:hypothetical protein